MVRSHNFSLKTQQFKVVSMFPHQYPTTFFILNSIFQTSIILSVETKMENMKNMWFETQYNFKLLTISIIISSNYINFFVCKKTISHYFHPSKLHPKSFPSKSNLKLSN